MVNLAAHLDVTVWSAMVTGVADEDIADLTSGALGVSVVMSSAGNPGVGLVDVLFAVRVGKAEEAAGEDRDDVLEVVDVVEVGDMSVDPVGPVGVANLSEGLIEIGSVTLRRCQSLLWACRKHKSEQRRWTEDERGGMYPQEQREHHLCAIMSPLSLGYRVRRKLYVPRL